MRKAVLCLCMCLALALTMALPAFAEESDNHLSISTVEEFLTFAKNLSCLNWASRVAATVFLYSPYFP